MEVIITRGCLLIERAGKGDDKKGGGLCVCLRAAASFSGRVRGQEHESGGKSGNDPARLASLLCLVLGLPLAACGLAQEAQSRFTHGPHGTKRYYIVQMAARSTK